MQYRINPKNGDRISALGFGCMRLGRDEKENARLIEKAIALGVNYFDTAYIYVGNEALLGRILPKAARKDIFLATKLPPYLVRKTADFDKLFETQCSRLQTDYIDYYFLHMLPNTREWQRLVDLGILPWIEGKKASGQIRNIGFSYHGGLPEFTALVDANDWDFCMLQYNYYDENSQTGKAGLQYAAGKGIPIMVMEPLRGGKLVNLPAEAQKDFDAAPERFTPAEWGLRWVWNHPEVMVALSGMNTMEMLEENVRIAADAQPESLSADALERIARVRKILMSKTHVACTGCNYCMPCPAGVDIPMCFTCYNDTEMMSPLTAWVQYIQRTNLHNASLCTQCGKCEKHCPQQIAIRKELATVVQKMERFPYKPARFVARKVMRLK